MRENTAVRREERYRVGQMCVRVGMGSFEDFDCDGGAEILFGAPFFESLYDSGNEECLSGVGEIVDFVLESDGRELGLCEPR